MRTDSSSSTGFHLLKAPVLHFSSNRHEYLQDAAQTGYISGPQARQDRHIFPVQSVPQSAATGSTDWDCLLLQESALQKHLYQSENSCAIQELLLSLYQLHGQKLPMLPMQGFSKGCHRLPLTV